MPDSNSGKAEQPCRFCGAPLHPTYQVCPSCTSNQSFIGTLLKWSAILGGCATITYFAMPIFSSVIDLTSDKPLIITHSNTGSVFTIENPNNRSKELTSAKIVLSIKNRDHYLIESFYSYSFPANIQNISEPTEPSDVRIIPKKFAQTFLFTAKPSKISDVDRLCSDIIDLTPATKLGQHNECSVNFHFVNSKLDQSSFFPCDGPYMRNLLQRTQAAFHMCSLIKEQEEIKTTASESNWEQMETSIQMQKTQLKKILEIE